MKKDIEVFQTFSGGRRVGVYVVLSEVLNYDGWLYVYIMFSNGRVGKLPHRYVNHADDKRL